MNSYIVSLSVRFYQCKLTLFTGLCIAVLHSPYSAITLVVNVLENIFIVGIPKDIAEISKFVFCESCGYGLSNEEELLVHRRSHGIM